MKDARIRIPRSALAIAAAVVVLAAVLLSPARDALSGLIPVATVEPAVLVGQREATEAAVAQSYRVAVAQVKRIRTFNLAITQAQADVIERKAYDDLAATRNSAIVSIGQAFKMQPIELANYLTAAQTRMAQVADGPIATVLAPGLYEIARRAGDRLAQIAEAASTELAGPPRPSPSPSPR